MLRTGSGEDTSEQQKQEQMSRLRSLCESLATDPSGSTALLALLDKLQDGLASVENMPVHQAQAVHSSRSYRYGGGGESQPLKPLLHFTCHIVKAWVFRQLRDHLKG